MTELLKGVVGHDDILILLLMLILYKNGADTELLLALGYILI